MTEDQRLRLARSLIFSGLILYWPANLWPVMTITITGVVEPLTILGGVAELWDSGLPGVALIVFLASFLVPLLKLVVLSWLLALHGTEQHQRARSNAFRILHQIGTWSMVDLFLLSVLTAVGQLGVLASVQPQPGAFFFAGVLLTTLFAAELYEPKMIWQTSRSANS